MSENLGQSLKSLVLIIFGNQFAKKCAYIQSFHTQTENSYQADYISHYTPMNIQLYPHFNIQITLHKLVGAIPSYLTFLLRHVLIQGIYIYSYINRLYAPSMRTNLRRHTPGFALLDLQFLSNNSMGLRNQQNWEVVGHIMQMWAKDGQRMVGGFSMFHKPAASRSDLVISNKHVGMGQNLFIRYDLGHKHPKIPAD